MLDMEEIVYVYKDPRVHYLIVKRNPFSYQIPSIDNEGYYIEQVLQGHAIRCPTWTDKKVHGKRVFAIAFNQEYEISDLEQK